VIAVVTVMGAHASVAASPWTGTWKFKPAPKTNWMPFVEGDTLKLAQSGSKISGTFGFQYQSDRGFATPLCHSPIGGYVVGTATGRTLDARLVWPAGDGYPRSVGPLKAKLSKSGRSFLVTEGMVTKGACGGFGAPFNGLIATRVSKP
jgi:hypothetical protein